LLKDSYEAIGQLDRAVAACRSAVKLKPGDKDLMEEFKSLSAKLNKSSEEAFMKPQELHLSTTEDSWKANEIEHNNGQLSAKAKAFFERGQEAGERDNFDYAIDMYIEGLGYAPDALAEGHIPLCELALRRQGKGC
jgi:tetratricopeptide (TPR) repeat protein